MNRTLLSLLCLVSLSGFPDALVAQPGPTGPAASPTVEDTTPKKEQPKAPATPKGPTLKAMEMYRTRTARTEVELQTLINELYRIIDYADDDDPEKPKYYGNLALLYWEKAESYYLAAYSNELDNGLIEARDNKDDARVAELEGKRQGLLDAQQEWRRKAVRVYKDIEEKYSEYPKLDMVLFYLGIALNQVGDFEDAFQSFKKLVTQFPGSNYIPDGLVNLGEYYFDQNQFGTAIEFYKRVEKFPDARVFAYAVYKQAWCLYNMGDYNESFKKFIAVINYQDEMEAKGMPPKLNLKDQALEDVVLVYSHIGQEKQAIDFFKKLSPQNYIPLTARLAKLYLETNDNEKAIYLFKLLISLAPESRDVLTYQKSIVICAEASGKKERTLTEVDQLASTYESVAITYPDFASGEAEGIAGLFTEMALRYHVEHQSTKEKLALKLVQQLYGHSLRLFPEAQGRYKMMRDRATLLYQLGEFEKASEAYEQVLAKEPEGIFAEEAAYFMYLCSYKSLETLAKPTSTRGEEEDLTVKELSPQELRFIAAADRVIKMSKSEARDIEDAIFLSARLLYNKNHFEEAAKKLEEFFAKFPKSDTAPEAARLILSSFALARNIPALNEWADRIYAMPHLAQGEILAIIQRIRNEAKFNRCFEFEGRKEFETAAECFVKYSKDFSGSNLVDKAYYNAGVNYQKAKKYEKALAVNGLLYNCCAKTSKQGPKALYNIAMTYQSAGAYEEAAQYFEEFVKRHPKEPIAEQAIFRAASLRRALGQYDLAIKDYDVIFKMFKKDERVPRLALDIGNMYTLQKNYSKAEGEYRKFIKNFGKSVSKSLMMEAYKSLGEALQAQKKADEARKAFVAVVDLLKAATAEERAALSGGAYFAIAWAFFNLGDDAFDQAAKLKYTRKNLQETVNQKLVFVKQAKAYFGKVLELRLPYWTSLSHYRVGLALERFSEELENSPVPPGLSEQEEIDYKVELTQFTETYRAEAANAFQACIEEARKARIFNEYTDKAEAKLAELNLASGGISEYRVRPEYLDLAGVLPLYKERDVVVSESQRLEGGNPTAPEPQPTPPPSAQPTPPSEPTKGEVAPQGGESK